MRYTREGRTEYDDGHRAYEDDGKRLWAAVTREISTEDAPFLAAIRALVTRSLRPDVSDLAGFRIFLTIEECWSGYSEYTVTSTWDEVVLSVPELNVEVEYAGIAQFLRALTDVAPDGEQ